MLIAEEELSRPVDRELFGLPPKAIGLVAYSAEELSPSMVVDTGQEVDPRQWALDDSKELQGAPQAPSHRSRPSETVVRPLPFPEPLRAPVPSTRLDEGDTNDSIGSLVEAVST